MGWTNQRDVLFGRLERLDFRSQMPDITDFRAPTSDLLFKRGCRGLNKADFRGE